MASRGTINSPNTTEGSGKRILKDRNRFLDNARADVAGEDSAGYNADRQYGYRDVEYEYEPRTTMRPEQSDAVEP